MEYGSEWAYNDFDAWVFRKHAFQAQHQYHYSLSEKIHSYTRKLCADAPVRNRAKDIKTKSLSRPPPSFCRRAKCRGENNLLEIPCCPVSWLALSFWRGMGEAVSIIYHLAVLPRIEMFSWFFRFSGDCLQGLCCGGGFYLYACIQGKAYRHNIRDEVSTWKTGFYRFSFLLFFIIFAQVM